MKAKRAARFETAEPPPPVRARGAMAHPGGKIVTSDANEKLLALIRKRLATGQALTPAQSAALQQLGIAPEDAASALGVTAGSAADIAVPAVYAEGPRTRSRGAAAAATPVAAPPPGRRVAAPAGPAAPAAPAAVAAPATAPVPVDAPPAVKGAKKLKRPAPAEAGPPAPVAAVGTSEAPVACSDAHHVRALEKKLRQIEELVAGGGDLNDAQRAKVARRDALIAELAAARA